MVFFLLLRHFPVRHLKTKATLKTFCFWLVVFGFSSGIRLLISEPVVLFHLSPPWARSLSGSQGFSKHYAEQLRPLKWSDTSPAIRYIPPLMCSRRLFLPNFLQKFFFFLLPAFTDAGQW